jgi:alpha-1,3-rhamnosyl/mannosyltransferase
VVHDLYHLIEPERVHPTRRRALAGLPGIVANAPRIQCVSRHTADDLVRLLDVPREKIDVVHPPVRPEFFMHPASDTVTRIGLRPRNYWLAVGMGESRKNLALLLDIIRHRPELCTPECPLVLAGAPAWDNGSTKSTLARLRTEGRVRELGFVSVPDLVALYAHAKALLMPSRYEGFGISLAEALAAETPAIASDNSSLREVSGGNAIHLNAEDVDGWANAMRELTEKGPDHDRIEAGRRHVSRFSREATIGAAIGSLDRLEL